MINNSNSSFNSTFLQDISYSLQLLMSKFLILIETTTALFFQTSKKVSIKLPIIYANIRV